MFITEIFKSIQGEGTRAGLPCIFVRLTGCNLRCTWCDTAYAFHGGTKMSVAEVAARVDQLAGRIPDGTIGSGQFRFRGTAGGINRRRAIAAGGNLSPGSAITRFGVHGDDRNQRRALHRQIAARSN